MTQTELRAHEAMNLMVSAACTDAKFHAWVWDKPIKHVDGSTTLRELARRGAALGMSAREIADEIVSKRERAFVQAKKGGEACTKL